ncbi:MAG: ABC transporter ATP-binding protein [Actinobacteria bacterium]|nr:ABC transporter ATP-binding protein [Actinomycetota bacterium]
MTVEPGRVRVRGVSRSFRIVSDRNLTLKETLLRGRRRVGTTELWAVRDVDLDVSPGEAVGLVGENGSGKSTLLKLIAGIFPPTAGTIETGGTVASMLELGAGFHPDFSGRENVYMNAAIHGLSEREVDRRMPEIVAFAEIPEFIDMPVRTYSSGMQMRLAFSVASHVNPDILLLDEVLAVGDEAFQRKCFGRIFEYRRRGGTIVFVSHDAGAVERVCDRAVLMVGGRVAEAGGAHSVLTRYHRLLAHSEDAGDAPAIAADEGRADDGAASWGTMDVAITGVRLIGPDGPTKRLLSGDPLTIEIDLQPRVPVLTPSVGIAIQTVDGAACFGTNTALDAFPVERMDEPVTARFAIERLNLLEGRFTLTVAVHSNDDRLIYHWLERVLEFSVFPVASGVGPVDLGGTWSLGPRDGRAVDASARPHRVGGEG